MFININAGFLFKERIIDTLSRSKFLAFSFVWSIFISQKVCKLTQLEGMHFIVYNGSFLRDEKTVTTNVKLYWWKSNGNYYFLCFYLLTQRPVPTGCYSITCFSVNHLWLFFFFLSFIAICTKSKPKRITSLFFLNLNPSFHKLET